MYPIALEETWKMTRWSCHVFQFLMAVTSKVKLLKYAKQSEKTFHSNCKALSKELINNKYLSQDKEHSILCSQSALKTAGIGTCHCQDFTSLARMASLQDARQNGFKAMCMQ